MTILGLHQNYSSQTLTKNFIFRWTLPLCNHQLFVQTIGTDPIILTNHVKMRFVETGTQMLTVEPCGLIHPTGGLLSRGLQKLKANLTKGQRWYYWFPQEPIQRGGTIIVSSTKLDLLEED
jgi:hypothetical protein